MLRILAILFATALTCAAQDSYNVIDERTLSAASGAITIQAKATGGSNAKPQWVSLQCSVACSVYLEKNGTAATTTALTPVAVNDDDTTVAKFDAFHTSNVGAGTKISATYDLAASQILTLDLAGLVIKRNNNTKNITIRIGTMTGSYKVHLRVDVDR